VKVALLTREFPPEVYGGAGVHVEYLSRALAEHVEIDVRCFGAPRPSPLVGRAYPDRPGGALGALAVDLEMAVDVGGADLVHSHTWYTNMAGHLAGLVHGIPHVVTAHSLEPLRPWKAEQLGGGYRVSTWCEQVALEGADAIIAVSAAMRDDITRVYPAVDPARVHVIHNGIDAAEYRPADARDALARHGIGPDYALFVGRMTRQKGLDLLLDAAGHIDVQLVVCAGAPDTAELGDELRARANTMRGEGVDIVWIEAMLPRPELVQLMSHAAVLVCPSVYEPFGLINLEAMACATAVVATTVGGIPEIVVDGETGTLVPVDADALAGAVNALVQDPATAARFGAAGRERVLEHFTWPAIARETAARYRAVLHG
jgi:starch synthase